MRVLANRCVGVHNALSPLSVAGREAGILVQELGVHVPALPHCVAVLERASLPLWKLLAHLRLALALWTRSRGRTILVREFQTAPFAIILPLLLPLARRSVLLLHHNLGRASRSRAEAALLRAYARCGFRLAVMEDPDVLQEFRIPPSRRCALPHPVPPPAPWSHRSGPLRIGCVGRFRAEKNIPLLLEAVQTAATGLQLPYELVLGCDDATLRATWAARGYSCMDTGQAAAYRECLAGLDVLVLGYDAASYRYRASGVIADAIAAGVHVLAPDLPLIRAQLAQPCAAGATYPAVEDLAAGLAAACALARAADARARLQRQVAARSVTALAAQLAALAGPGRRRGLRAANPAP